MFTYNKNIHKSSMPYIIYGAGELGKKVSIALEQSCKKVLHFCDNDPLKWFKNYQGKVILPPHLAFNKFKKTITIIAIWAPKFDSLSTIKLRRSFNSKNILPFQFLGEYFPGIFPHYQFVKKNFYSINKKKIIDFKKKLYDLKSKKIYQQQIQWRVNLGYGKLDSPEFHNQYLPKDIIKPQMLKYFVDCGAFDGDTAKSALKFAFTEIKKMYLFEPDNKNYQKIKYFYQNLNQRVRNKIIIKKYGVGLRDKKMFFSSSGTTSSQILSSKGTSVKNTIKVVKLDTVMKNKRISFIKMDIEGFELSALQGAKNVIIKNRPVLAICIYHKPEDIYLIGEYIISLKLNYRYFIRSHDTQGLELVLYCVPN